MDESIVVRSFSSWWSAHGRYLEGGYRSIAGGAYEEGWRARAASMPKSPALSLTPDYGSEGCFEPLFRGVK